MKLKPAYKKILGLMIAVPFGLILVLSVVYIIMILVAGTPGNRPISELVFEALVAMAFMVFPVHRGLRLFSSGRDESNVAKWTHPVDTYTVIYAESRITLPEYTKLSFILAFQNPAVLGVLMIGVGFVTAIFANPGAELSLYHLIPIVFGPAMLVLMYFNAKKGYASNVYLKEKVAYEFNVDNVVVKGESFNSLLRWSALHKVVESGKYFFLYTSPQTAMIIPKAGFPSREDVDTLKGFVANTGGLQKELKS